MKNKEPNNLKRLIAILLLAIAFGLCHAARAAETGEAEKAPAAETTPAPLVPTPEEVADRIEQRYSGITSYAITFTLWRPELGKKFNEEKLRKDWKNQRKRIEKYTLWYRDGTASGEADSEDDNEGDSEGDDYVRLRGTKGVLRGTEVFYDPTIKAPRVTVLRGRKVMKLSRTDPRLADFFKTDVRLLAARTVERLRDPEIERKVQHENEGGNIILTTKPIPLYKGDDSRTKTTRWTLTLAPDNSLRKMVLEEKHVAPPGLWDALKKGLKTFAGIPYRRPKPEFKVMSIHTWGELETENPLPEDHFIYKKPKAGEKRGR